MGKLLKCEGNQWSLGFSWANCFTVIKAKDVIMYITTVNQCCTSDYTRVQMMVMKTIWNASTSIRVWFQKLPSFYYDSEEYCYFSSFLFFPFG